MMKRVLSLGLIGVALAGLARSATPPAGSGVVNGVMVIVDNEIITRKDVMQYIAPTVDLLMERYRTQPDVLNQRLNDALKEGVEQLVERKLILREFEAAGYSLPESVIEDRVRERIRERYGGDRVALTRTLQGQGSTYEAFKRRTREDFIIAALSATKVSREKILVSPHKMEKYYAANLEKFKVGDQYKIRTLMINRGGRNTPTAATALAGEIVSKLNEGASFAEMATIHSEDSFRTKGGERGWIELEKERYQKPLEDAIKSLKAGQHSGAVEAGEALWIVLLEEAKPLHYRPLAEVRDEVEEALIAEERNRLRKQWIDRLKAKSFVRYF